MRAIAILRAAFLSSTLRSRDVTMGADDRIRTDDPRFTKALLCQLSYVGMRIIVSGSRPAGKNAVGQQSAARGVFECKFSKTTFRIHHVGKHVSEYDAG